ncbi:MAG TPA: phosphoribosylanthranilate isomerase [Ktedonobacterales bacterium]
MEPTSKPKVKICCIGSVAEARLAIRYGASAVGLVSEMPSGPGVIAEEDIARIAGAVPPPILSVLLTSKQDTASIIAQQRRCGVSAIQIVDRLITGNHRDLRSALPGIRLIQVIHVCGEESFEEALAVAPQVDALLLDSGNQSLAIKELGGTGRVHDWRISRAIREAVDVPVFLAGGLNAENISDAVNLVSPFAIDLCSGVRTNGALDETKLARLFARLAQP